MFVIPWAKVKDMLLRVLCLSQYQPNALPPGQTSSPVIRDPSDEQLIVNNKWQYPHWLAVLK